MSIAEPRPAPVSFADVPAVTPESTALSKALKKRGFVFVGPTTMYALMEAVGVFDDHLAGCHRRGDDGRDASFDGGSGTRAAR